MDHGAGSDREAIRDVLARYNLAGDRGRIADVIALFEPSGVLVTDAGEYAGAEAIGGLFTAVTASAERVRHFTSTVVIDVTGDTATASSYFQVLTGTGLDHWGRYRDQLRRTPAGWRFTRREVRVDGQVPGGWAARQQARHEAP